MSGPLTIAGGAVAVELVVRFGLPPYYVYLAVLTVFACIGASALNLLMGHAGLVSIGNAGFMAVGAFAAVGAAPHGGFLASLVAGAVAAGVAGLLVGAVSMRLRGFYLVLTTLALQYIVAFLGREIEAATNSPAGYTLDIPTIGSWVLDSDQRWFLCGLVLLCAQLVVIHLVMRGRVGRAFLAIREYENAASVVGVDVARYKLLAFTTSSAMIGVGGAALAYYVGSVDIATYTLDLAVSYAAMVLIGGLGSAYGPLLGAALVTLLPALLSAFDPSGGTGFVGRNASSLQLLAYGCLIIAVVVIEPGGLAALGRRWIAPLLRGGGRVTRQGRGR